MEVSPPVVVANTNSGLPWHHILKTWLNVVPSQRMPFFDLAVFSTVKIPIIIITNNNNNNGIITIGLRNKLPDEDN